MIIAGESGLIFLKVTLFDAIGVKRSARFLLFLGFNPTIGLQCSFVRTDTVCKYEIDYRSHLPQNQFMNIFWNIVFVYKKNRWFSTKAHKEVRIT